MTQINYVKMSGSGNVFTIIDSREEKLQLSKKQINTICNNNKTSCDQLILIKDSLKGDIGIDIYNNDGTIAGICGNASRCIAILIMKEFDSDEIAIETMHDVLKCKKLDDQIEVNMGIPRFNWRQIPLKKEIRSEKFRLKHPSIPDIEKMEFIAVSMGNPHIVTFLEKEITDDIFFEAGPFLENHPLFPDRTNIEFAHIIAPNHIKVRVWERGAGETKACGSGACAVVAVANKKSLIDPKKEIIISFKGGDLRIKNNRTGSLTMIGDYQELNRGSFEILN